MVLCSGRCSVFLIYAGRLVYLTGKKDVQQKLCGDAEDIEADKDDDLEVAEAPNYVEEECHSCHAILCVRERI